MSEPKALTQFLQATKTTKKLKNRINKSGKIRVRSENKPLTQDQVNKIMSICDELRDSTILNLGFNTGMRVSEVSSFTQDGIDWQTGEITIWDEKKNVYRNVTAPKDTLMKLKIWINSSKPGPNKVFNVKWKAIESLFQKWCFKALGFKRSWHTVRHTYVMLSVENGVPPAVVQKNTGDKPTTILGYYSKVSPGFMQKVMNEKPIYSEETKIGE